VALVTGAAAGMGLATARAFADSGAAVVLADRDEQRREDSAAAPRAVARRGARRTRPQRRRDRLLGPRRRPRLLLRQRRPYFNGIVRIGQFDDDTNAIERQDEDFSVTIERAE
jgi:NAD(P)-dependent dehydrogenase (short-subunit alcohol dehydrogenase family)